MKEEPIRGLYLGKFAPLHWGHEAIIAQALNEVEELIIMIYDSPEVTDVPLTVRASWFKRFGPRVRVIQCWNPPLITGYTKKAMQANEEYVIRQLCKYRPGRHINKFFSAERYGEHMSKALGAEDRRIKKREWRTSTISATMIRKEMYKYRHLVEGEVYEDHIVNCVFMGGPSTGKSTLCEALSKEFKTEWMPEYGREYWETHQIDRKLTPRQLDELATLHLMHEIRHLREANKVLFTDTNAITTLLFNRYYHGEGTAIRGLKDMADLCQQRYDLFFVCGDEFPMDDTADRSGDGQRKLLQAWTIDELRKRKIPYYYLAGSLYDRIEKVKKILKNFKKWRSVENEPF